MELVTIHPCADCQALQAQVDSLRQQLEAALDDLTRTQTLLAAARKDSSTSSKPPSSDLVKPSANPDDLSLRQPGGQPNHPKHSREPFPPEQVTQFQQHLLECCPDCGGLLSQHPTLAHVVQQVDVQAPVLTVQQHTCPMFWCDGCQRGYQAPLPVPIQRGGLVGPQLTALIAFLKGVCHASFSTVRLFLRDVVGVSISRGQLSKILGKVTQALDGSYQELLELLPNEPVLNVDETGHKDQGDRWWTWCLRAELYTLYHIDAHRNADVLMDLLGKEFQGVLGCDYFSAYRRYLRECDVTVQFCLAHLIRDVKFLLTLPDARDRQYGEQLRGALKSLFEVYHQRATLPEATFASRLQGARDEVLRVGKSAPPTRHGQNLAKRFAQHGESYFRFVTTAGVEPTNNLAEQAIRFVVIDRHITQGTRSEGGRRYCERMWTVIATCVGQGKSVWVFLLSSLGAWFVGEQGPSLLG